MGISRNDLKILASQTSGPTRAALEAIAGDGKGSGEATAKQLANGRQAHKRGQVSGAEQRYCDAYIYPRIMLGKVVDCEHESVRIKLPHGASYSPDWVVTRSDGVVEYHEVKGTEPADRDRDSRNRWKWSASLNPDARWIWAKEQKGGGFKIEVIEPRTRQERKEDNV